MVTLIPEMKSGTPKTCTMTPNTGQLKNSVKVFDELVVFIATILDFTPWNPQIETNLKEK